jgi:hypothetical protein
VHQRSVSRTSFEGAFVRRSGKPGAAHTSAPGLEPAQTGSNFLPVEKTPKGLLITPNRWHADRPSGLERGHRQLACARHEAHAFSLPISERRGRANFLARYSTDLARIMTAGLPPSRLDS